MNWKTLAALALAAAAYLVGARIASAQDFNITVPVRLNSFPREVAQGEIWCWAGLADMPNLDIGGLGPDRSGKTLGRGRTAFPIDGNSGSFIGNVTVQFSADPGKNPGDATRYLCVLRLMAPQSEPREPSVGVGGLTDARQGTPLTTRITGSLIPPAQSPVRQAPGPAREMKSK